MPSRRAGGSVWYRQLAHCETLVMAGHPCGRCGQPIDLDEPRNQQGHGLTVGHIIDLHDGGDPNSLDNVRPEGRSCNIAAGNQARHHRKHNRQSRQWF